MWPNHVRHCNGIETFLIRLENVLNAPTSSARCFRPGISVAILDIEKLSRVKAESIKVFYYSGKYVP